MSKTGLIFTFYKNFMPASLTISVACASILYAWGLSVFGVQFWLKILATALIFWVTHNYKKSEYPYYQNLLLSKTTLWVSSLSVDMIIYTLLITLILITR